MASCPERRDLGNDRFSNRFYYNTAVIQGDLIREAIEAANRNFEAIFRSGDAEAMTSVYTDDAQLLPTGSDPIHKDGLVQFWQSVLQMGVDSAKLETLEVDPQGATAIELGRYTLQSREGQILDRGKYIVIWKLVKGEWKMHRDIWNTSLPLQQTSS
jgi:ketosteroid isomerase-like protein